MPSSTPLALIGYGKMGRLIEQLAPQHGFEVVVRLTSESNRGGQGISAEGLHGAAVAIEFSNAEAAPANLRKLAELNIPVVTGTTGWAAHREAVFAQFLQHNGGLVWGPNFSVGVAIFNRLVGMAASLFKDQSAYGAWAWEIHHDAKKDAPSGTLLQLVDTIRASGYTRYVDTSANRSGRHPGTHEIGFDSAADTITLRHTARSREGFAEGALKSARWVIGKKGVFSFEDVLFGG